MHDVNVLGTRHLLDACAAAGVPRLVYTSSASVRAPMSRCFPTGQKTFRGRRGRVCLAELSCPRLWVRHLGGLPAVDT